jgi:hypothetical protein
VSQRRVEASPQREDFEREFGKDKVKTEKDGSWSLSLKETADIKRARQMQAGLIKMDRERGLALDAKHDGKRQRVVRKDGRVVDIRDEAMEQVHKGVRPVGRNGGAPSLKFGLSESFGKYRQGGEGLWFVWNDGWEPTRLWESQAKGDEQHDPDGNVWVRKEGDWTLAEE